MAHCDMAKSVVRMTWYDKRRCSRAGDDNQLPNTGFVIARRDNESQKDSLGILTTCHQLRDLFPQDMAPEYVGATIVFFDGATTLEGELAFHDADQDLACVIVYVDSLRTHNPLSCVHPVIVSNDRLNYRQEIYTVHHPVLLDINTHRPTQLYFQQCSGFIADGSDPTIVHFHLPLTMPGSSGAPIFDAHSNNLVSIVKSGDTGIKYPGTPTYIERQYGISVPTIQNFMGRVRAKYEAP